MQRCTPCLNESWSIRIATVKLRGDHQRYAAHSHRRRRQSTKPLCRHEKTVVKPRNLMASNNTYKPVVERCCVPNYRVSSPGALGAARGRVMFQRACWVRSTARRLIKPPPACRPHLTWQLRVVCSRAAMWSPRKAPILYPGSWTPFRVPNIAEAGLGPSLISSLPNVFWDFLVFWRSILYYKETQ